jgi:tryptophanyl-tRNA synthetase
VQNLLSIYQAFSEDDDSAMRNKFTGMRYGDLKKQVAEMVIAHLEPLQGRYKEITQDPGYVESILREGAERVRPIAAETVELAKRRMGLYTAA